ILTTFLGAIITAAVTAVFTNSPGIFTNSDVVRPTTVPPVPPSPTSPTSESPVPTSRPSASSTPTAPPRTLHAGDYVLTEGIETVGLVRDTAPDGPPDSQDSDAKFAACLGVPVAQVQSHESDSADGPTLKSTDELTILESHAYIVPAAEVIRDRTFFGHVQAPRCLGLLFFPGFQKAMSAGGMNATLDSAYSMTTPAGATIAVRIGVTVTAANGNHVTWTFDMISIMSGRVESWITIMQLNGTPDPVVEQNVTLQVAGKIVRQ
ncbi:hypothetical protein, partial [Frankia sp. Cr1]|uniref:hypothetical protein n=1 Tax=Frankia sp. Cr1 TaxID=3073931 RepID=UPI002AD43F0E